MHESARASFVRLRRPRLLEVGGAYVADSATLCGAVTLGEGASLWYGAVVRGDDAPITIGARTNVQDNAVVHVDPGVPNRIGRDVTIGHSAVVHGAEIGDGALVGMGAVLLGGSRIGEGSIVGAGALVLESQVVPPFVVVVGAPARVVRQLDPEARRKEAVEHAAAYVEQARRHAAGVWDESIQTPPDSRS